MLLQVSYPDMRGWQRPGMKLREQYVLRAIREDSSLLQVSCSWEIRNERYE